MFIGFQDMILIEICDWEEYQLGYGQEYKLYIYFFSSLVENWMEV